MSDQDALDITPAQTPEQIAAAALVAAAPVVPADVFSDQLASIKNADGTPKYADVAQALDSIPHAQDHITTIEGENESLKAALAKAEAAKELLEKAGNANQQTAGLTVEEVAQITQDTLAAQADSSRKADNVISVNSKFSELYGDKANEQMKALAKDSGITVAEIKTIAEKSPLAVFRMAGINSQSTPAPRTPGEGVGDNFQPPLKKTDPPKSVMSGATSQQMVDNWKAAREIIKQQ